MQIHTSMSALRHHAIEPALLARLLELVPEGKYRGAPNDKDGFKLDLPESDPRVGAVLSLLALHGYTQDEYPDAKRKHYRLVRRRTYDASDVAQAPFFWVESCEVNGSTDGERTADNLLQLAREVVREWEEVTLIRPTFVVPLADKERLEQAGFNGLVMRPTVQTAPGRGSKGETTPLQPVAPDSPSESWWELRSDTTIGPMQRVTRLALGARPDPLPTGVRGPGRFASEGFFDFRPVYARAAIEAVAGKDIVETWEYPSRPSEPEMLYSPRLREAIRQIQPACKWIPVQVVDL